MKNDAVLWQIALAFLQISLVSIGGANAVVPELHRHAVEVHGWMGDAQFVQLYALAQAAPGPNVLVVTLIGLQTAGIAGALVATAAMCGPTCVLTYFVYGAWHRARAARWRQAVQAGLAPVTVGLVAGSAWLLAETSNGTGALGWGLTAAAAAGTLATRLNPLWLLAAAAAMGIVAR